MHRLFKNHRSFYAVFGTAKRRVRSLKWKIFHLVTNKIAILLPEVTALVWSTMPVQYHLWLLMKNRKSKWGIWPICDYQSALWRLSWWSVFRRWASWQQEQYVNFFDRENFQEEKHCLIGYDEALVDYLVTWGEIDKCDEKEDKTVVLHFTLRNTKVFRILSSLNLAEICSSVLCIQVAVEFNKASESRYWISKVNYL